MMALAFAAAIIIYDEIDSALTERVVSGKAEFSISTFKSDPELVTQNVLVDSFVSVICHRHLNLARKESVTWKDLLDQRVINPFRGESVQHMISTTFPIDGKPSASRFEIG